MASESSRDWSVPTPVRALLWWPPVAFVLVTIRPEAAPVAIAAAGAVLAVLGVVASAVTRRQSRRAAGDETGAAPVSLAATPDAVAVPAEQRAA